MRDTQREAETQAVGLDPGPLGSCPEPKADAQLLSHPGAPEKLHLSSGPYVCKPHHSLQTQVFYIPFLGITPNLKIMYIP